MFSEDYSDAGDENIEDNEMNDQIEEKHESSEDSEWSRESSEHGSGEDTWRNKFNEMKYKVVSFPLFITAVHFFQCMLPRKVISSKRIRVM